MPNLVGDNLLGSIQWGGWSDVTVQWPRGETEEATTLLPSIDGKFRETPKYHQGLDGRIDLKYYERELVLDFIQTDGETLADLYAEAMDALFHETGLEMTLTWRNGAAVQTTMYTVRELHNEGPGGHVGVLLNFRNTALTPLMR